MSRKGEGFIQWVEKKKDIFRSTGDSERTVELEFIHKDKPYFDLDDLFGASADQLGKGKLGNTYKATLEFGSVVTVKRLRGMNGLSNKEFVQQMRLRGSIRHENIVEIISFYHSMDEKLVVYEYVNDGSLFDLLHENRVGRTAVKWSTRLSIVKGVAKGLNYLHQSLPPSHKVPHGNLKSSNILIHHHDQKYQPKITDFGFLPLLPSRKTSKMLLASERTPEFSQGKKLTHKADVYCFGLVVLEVITGRMPPGNGEDLAEWATNVANNDWSTDILDMELLVAYTQGHHEMFGLTDLALQCTAIDPERRPRMSEVLRRIEEIEEKSSKNGEKC